MALKKKQQKQECGHDPNFRGICVNISLDTVSGGKVGHEGRKVAAVIRAV